MIIRIKEYPHCFSFEYFGKLPTTDSKAYLDARTRLVRKYMKLAKVNSPIHDYSDYCVENVCTYKNSETWYLGS